MTTATTTAPATPTPAAASTPANASAAEPAASSAATPPAKGRRSLADSLVGVDADDGDDASSEASSEPAVTTDTTAAAKTETAATPSKLETLKAKLRADAEARAAKQAQDEQQRHVAGLQKQLDDTLAKPSMNQFLDEFRRSPASTLRKYGIDPRKHLDALTEDALTPGAAAARVAAEQGDSETKALRERIDRMEAEAAQREAVAAGNRNNLEFLEATSNAEKYPRLAALDNEMRLELAMDVWQRLAADRHPYDRDTLAELVEARLDAMHSRWAPPPATDTPSPPAAAPNAPSRTTSASPASPAATTRTPRTLTPALQGETSGSARRGTPRERRQALANSLVAVDTDD